MMSGKAQSTQQPTAFGTLAQASAYGMTIPRVMGCTLAAPLFTWAGSLRPGHSGKKGKASKKGGVTTYVEAATGLLCYAPALAVMQAWANGTKWPMDFTSTTFTGATGTSTYTLSDSNFYAVVAVTVTESYSATFNDYGDLSGGGTYTGSYERPLWNELIAGPDPVDASGARYYPYVYRWQPSYGHQLFLDGGADGSTFNGKTITVYYARLSTATAPGTPLTKLNLHFEAELGNGDEYTGLTSQQILYPQYSGIGGQAIDLGASGTLPAMKLETLGPYVVYPSRDADITDMIEDVLKSGTVQASLGGNLGFGGVMHGVNANAYPGTLQKRFNVRSGTSNAAIAYNLPNAAGNALVAFFLTDNATPGTCSDTGGNTWTLRGSGSFSGPLSWACYTCDSCAAKVGNVVTFTNPGLNSTLQFVLELPGPLAFDVAAQDVSSVSITTTSASGRAGLLYALTIGSAPAPAATNFWPTVLAPMAVGGLNVALQQRTVANAGTYAYKAATGTQATLLLSFKATQPPQYPNPIPDLLDPYWRQQALLQCRANGLWGSLNMNAQKPAREWIKDLCTAGNIAPVMSGFSLKLIPRSEVSAVGNGAIYTAPTASGPVADLDVDKGDFLASANESPIKLVRKARTSLDSVLQLQHLNRSSDYAQTSTTYTDAASVALYGTRKAQPQQNNCIHDSGVALMVLSLGTRKANYLDATEYQFKLNARWQLLEAMDLITLTWRAKGWYKVPVRLTSVAEDNKFERACTAEPFMYGMSAPKLLTAPTVQQYRPVTGTPAGSVNAPVIFEPTPRLYGAQNQAQLWLAVSSSNANYGGCQVYLSTDGGASYNLVGALSGSAITGVTTAAWAAASSPDTTNDLSVDLTESNGTLASYQVSDEDNFVYPCYVAGGGSYSIPYELMTYATATLTATNKYTLKATGTGNHLDRGVWGAPALGVGVAHPSGSRFAFLPPSAQGILKLTMDPAWVGKTLYFKFPSFNTFNAAEQSLSDCTAYSYTIAGTSGSVNPTGVPPQTFTVNGV